MARLGGGAGACLAGLLPLLGCASLGLGIARGLPDGGRECPGALVPTREITGEFLWRQQVRVQGDGLDWRLSLVVQKRGETLVLVGLDAFGAKEFVLTQTGVAVTVERPRGRLPLPPINLLRDLHRARFLAAAARPEEGVALLRSDGGGVTIAHAHCGYRVTLAGFEATPLSPANP